LSQLGTFIDAANKGDCLRSVAPRPKIVRHLEGRAMLEFAIQFLPMELIQLVFLLGVVPLARRVSPKYAIAWIICSLIPIFGIAVFSALFVKALLAILDRLDALKPAP
jgi:hypothetical protein